MRAGFLLVLATDNRTLCQPNMYRIYTVPYPTKWQFSSRMTVEVSSKLMENIIDMRV
ncbi:MULTISPECIES: hypothetical protein [unclassified Bacillus (in: firmicutes)]|uniref:hypothetical protein n=1 Tax=unclassified Bacillus (in: firmicutes) TaxID=185979 RepID=UPI00178C36C0|nr:MULTISPECIES: hypothetical protein [unclassified Bacillus (in: firmicutes)]